jgi:hypothetical protein
MAKIVAKGVDSNASQCILIPTTTKREHDNMKHGTLINLAPQEISAEYIRLEALVQKNKKYKFRKEAVANYAHTQRLLCDEYQRRLILDPTIGPLA